MLKYIDLKSEKPEDIRSLYIFLCDNDFMMSALTREYLMVEKIYSDGLIIERNHCFMSPKPSSKYVFKTLEISEFIKKPKLELLTGKTKVAFFNYFFETNDWTERDVLIKFETKSETERLAIIVNWLDAINIYVCPEYAGENKFRPLVTYKQELKKFLLKNSRNEAIIKSIEYINNELN